MRLLAKHGADPKVIHQSKYVQGAKGNQRRAERTTAIMAALGMGGGTAAWVPIYRTERDALILETV